MRTTARAIIRYDLFTRVALMEDLRRGDLATIVEQHPSRPYQEPGYCLELLNATGYPVSVATVSESQIEPLTCDEMLTVRPSAATTR